MKKTTIKKIIIISSIILFICLVSLLAFFISKNYVQSNLNNKDWLRRNVTIIKDKSLGNNIYSVTKNKNISIYKLEYQQTVREKINELLSDLKDDYLIIYNPYGTNKLSVNIYFKNTSDFENLNYTIKSSKEQC